MSNDQKWWNEFWTKAQISSTTVTLTPETWHDLVWQVTFDYWQEFFEKFAPGRTILECGCGSARVSQYLGQRGYRCTLLDTSDQAILIAKRNFEALSQTANFVLGDIHHLCLADKKFDVVYSGGVLEFMDDLGLAVKEMVRVLKPGGVFAANIVPPKFSIQSIADIERTVVYSIRNLLRGRFTDACRRVRQVPNEYHVHSWTLDHYVHVCEEAGLTSVKGFVTSPFPALALPKGAQKLYGRAMKALLPQWRKFNESQGRWSEWWGIGYTIYGIKE